MYVELDRDSFYHDRVAARKTLVIRSTWQLARTSDIFRPPR